MTDLEEPEPGFDDPVPSGPVEDAASTPAMSVDVLAAAIRFVDGHHSLGAGALAEALMSFLDPYLIRPFGTSSPVVEQPEPAAAWTDDPGDVFAADLVSYTANTLLRELMTAMGESRHARDQSPSEVWAEMLDKIRSRPVLPLPDDEDDTPWLWLDEAEAVVTQHGKHAGSCVPAMVEALRAASSNPAARPVPPLPDGTGQRWVLLLDAQMIARLDNEDVRMRALAAAAVTHPHPTGDEETT